MIYAIELFGYSTSHRPFFLDQFHDTEEAFVTYRYATTQVGDLMLLPDVVSVSCLLSAVSNSSDSIDPSLVQIYEHNLANGRSLPLSEALELELRGKAQLKKEESA